MCIFCHVCCARVCTQMRPVSQTTFLCCMPKWCHSLSPLRFGLKSMPLKCAYQYVYGRCAWIGAVTCARREFCPGGRCQSSISLSIRMRLLLLLLSLSRLQTSSNAVPAPAPEGFFQFEESYEKFIRENEAIKKIMEDR